jgi:hypothetical protein
MEQGLIFKLIKSAAKRGIINESNFHLRKYDDYERFYAEPVSGAIVRKNGTYEQQRRTNLKITYRAFKK